MSAFIIKLLRGERPVIYGSGEKRRDFIYVDDVNDFHLRCIEDERTEGEVYNLGTGVNYSVREIYDEIAAQLGSTIEPEYRPDFRAKRRPIWPTSGAARALGWEPRVDLPEGLRRSIDYIKAHV